MKNVEVGQEIYAILQSGFLGSEGKLEKYFVTKVNGTSFYARQNDSETEWRFNRKTWFHDGAFGFSMKAYETEEECYKIIELRAERSRLQNAIKESLGSLSTSKLREVNEIINQG